MSKRRLWPIILIAVILSALISSGIAVAATWQQITLQNSLTIVRSTPPLLPVNAPAPTAALPELKVYRDAARTQELQSGASVDWGTFSENKQLSLTLYTRNIGNAGAFVTIAPTTNISSWATIVATEGVKVSQNGGEGTITLFLLTKPDAIAGVKSFGTMISYREVLQEE